jgi:2,3-dihydroxybenzoate decarboxylase
MTGKIALEEHFAIPEYNQARPPFISEATWPDLHRRLADFNELRLPAMDASGIEYAVISLNSPAVQGERDARQAVERARSANDALAAAVGEHRDRFGGFAAVPLQDTGAAIEELRRAVQELGFLGVTVNSWTSLPDGSTGYLDQPRFAPFWSALADLGVPLYLHPRTLPGDQRGGLAGRPELSGPVWEFTADTATTALRLITSGLFDRHPAQQVILGHLGEGLPYNIWRIDNRLRLAATPPELRHPVSEYFRRNLSITTSGHFCTPSLLAAAAIVGDDRVMFSVDYPFEDMSEGATWFDGLDLPADQWRRIARDNAVRLLGLRNLTGVDAV